MFSIITLVVRSKYCILVTVLILAFKPYLKAQNFTTKKNTSDKAKTYFAEGFKKVLENENKAALKIFLAAESADNNFIDAKIQISSMYLELKDTTKALQYLNKAYDLNCCYEIRVPFRMGDLYYKQRDFKKAEFFFLKYIDSEKASPELKFKARKFARDAHFIDSALQKPVSFLPHRLSDSVNIPGANYRAIFNLEETELYFTNQVNRQEDIYFSRRDSSGNWLPAQPFNVVNTDGNEGSHALSADGKTFIFTACNRNKSEGIMDACDIYVTKKTGNKWGEAKPISKAINTEYFESQPSLSADGKTLFFASSRPGGFGNIDIWFSEFKNGNWTKPRNCGSTINTPYDDEMPFIHPDGKTFYFSSAGHAGMGERDIFVSERIDDTTFSTPKNIGYPINSANDDVGLTVSANGKTAFLAKRIEDKNFRMDLFTFDLPESVRAHPVSYMKCRVKNAKTLQPVVADVELSELETNKKVFQQKTDDVGEFIVALESERKFAANVSAKGYIFFSENFGSGEWRVESGEKQNDTQRSRLNSQLIPYIKDIFLQPINDSTTIPSNTKPKEPAATVLKNVFFETNKADLTAVSHFELDKLVKLLSENPNMKIEIRGHTDNVGKPADNKILSEKRAKAVFDYLINHGITSLRLRYSGKGETIPIDTNTTESGRGNNRRTDFQVF